MDSISTRSSIAELELILESDLTFYLTFNRFDAVLAAILDYTFSGISRALLLSELS